MVRHGARITAQFCESRARSRALNAPIGYGRKPVNIEFTYDLSTPSARSVCHAERSVDLFTRSQDGLTCCFAACHFHPAAGGLQHCAGEPAVRFGSRCESSGVLQTLR
jgi:hypothetical protein